MTWIYRNSPYLTPPSECAGFVYEISDHVNGMYYIGKKQFWSTRKLPPLKGKTRKRHRTVESDWQSYWGSSERLLQQIQQHGEDKFTRTILILCKNKAQMSYYEAKLQFHRDVLLDPTSYNGIINCRVSGRGLL